MRFPLVGPGYLGRSPNLDAQRCVNFYPEVSPQDAKDVTSLIGTPGTALWAALSAGIVRDMHPFNGLLFVVIGGKLHSVSPTGVLSPALGTLQTSSGRVLIADNGLMVSGASGNQLMITDGVQGYVYNVKTGNFLTLSSPQYSVAGTSAGTFVNQETVVQASTGATAQIIGAAFGTTMNISALTGAPDSSHTWTGQSSGATFAPTGAPVLSSTGWPGNPVALTFIAGYFIVAPANSMTVYSCNLYDSTTWNPLALSPVSAAPDFVQALANVAEYLWIVKQYTTEVWYNPGTIQTAQGFPFLRMTGAVLDFGTSAPYSVGRGSNGIFFLANQRENDAGEMLGVVYIQAGEFAPALITPPAISYTWSGYPTLLDAFAYCYADGGHMFYVLTFPAANGTWVYDSTTKFWHERSTWAGSPYAIGRHVGNCYAYFAGMHLIGDYQSGNIYNMQNGIYQDNGNPLVSMRTCQHIADKKDLYNIFIKRFELDMETGVGDESTCENPVAVLAWSDDGGHKWSNDYTRPIGATGQYKARVNWPRLGYGRGKVFRLTISDPVKRVLIGGYLE